MFDKFFKKEVKTTNASENNNPPSDAQVEIKEVKEVEVSKQENKVTEVKANPQLPNDNVKDVTLSNSKEEVEETPPLTQKEMRALHVARYEDKIAQNPKFKKLYLIKNRKTKQIAEIRAASSFHACNIIGWRPNNVVLLGETLADQLASPPETQNSSTNGK
jgi:hypothetical protein